VDVFTDRPFTGNPLAVVYEGQALATAQMQAMAREFNLSETVFILPPTQPGATYRARIFTPDDELPFAGHPTVGAGVAVVRRGIAAPGKVVQECGVGLVSLEVGDGVAALTGSTPTVGPELDPGPLLAWASLTGADYAGPAPREASCGLPWPFLSVRPDALARARSSRPLDGGSVSVFAWDPDTRTAHTRVFAPDRGVSEDPATGSAALAFGVWLVASGLVPGDGESTYTIRQGGELHRPSHIEGTVTAVDGAAVSVTITGHVVPVARGEITVPPFVG
jgi:trans-2,3-dihydro-3-hydroxyanthranilate isomerase